MKFSTSSKRIWLLAQNSFGSLSPRGRSPSPHPPPLQGSPEGRVLPQRSPEQTLTREEALSPTDPEHHRALTCPPSHPADPSIWSIGQLQAHRGAQQGAGSTRWALRFRVQTRERCWAGRGPQARREGWLWQWRPMALPARHQGFPDPTSQGAPVCSGHVQDDGPRAGPGTRQHGWDHQGGALACDGPGFRSQMVDAGQLGLSCLPPIMTSGQAMGPGQPQVWAPTPPHCSPLGDLQ